MRSQLQRALTRGRGQTLALSGGGQWGAFGAGFLKGWTKVGTRPAEFDIVTGTSTGSLISTFAFLGSNYDDAVGDAYLSIQGDGDIMEKRLFLTLPFAESTATTKGLRRLIERTVTDAMIAKVAEEGQKGRRLYVGAAELDTGVFKPFDLTEIAARGPTARKDYVDALMASTAIPVLFPPVSIAGSTYIDGGVRRNVFLEVLVQEAGRLRRAGALTNAPEPAVYCLVNGTLNVGEQSVKRKVLAIARRTADILLDESTDGNLLRIYLQAQNASLKFRMTHVPSGTCGQAPPPDQNFNHDFMQCLHDAALDFAQKPDAWSDKPPLEESVP